MKRILSLVAAIIVAFASMSISCNAAGTLADCEVGSKFLIKENGTLQEWVLLAKDYKTTGNCLMIKSNAIGSGHPGVDAYSQVLSSSRSRAYSWVYYTSSLRTWLNNDYLNTFEANLVSVMKAPTIKTYNKSTSATTIVTATMTDRVFILAASEVDSSITNDSSAYDYSSKGCAGPIKTEPTLAYFNVTGTQFKAIANFGDENTQAWWLRDGALGIDDSAASSYSQYDHASIVRPSYSTGAIPESCGGTKKVRPCIVLPASTPAVVGEEITGEIIPSITSAEPSTVWAKTNSIVVTADKTEQYGLSTSEGVAPDTWSINSTGTCTLTTTTNGKVYVWVKSKTNNTAVMEVTTSKADTINPTIDSIEKQETYGATNTITASASDTPSGVKDYNIVKVV